MTRKWWALCALLISLSFLSACMAVEAAPLIGQQLAESTSAAVERQVGTPDALMVCEGEFSYVVLYPDTGYRALDNAIKSWAQSAVADAVTARTLSDDGRQGGEMMVHYESHLLDGRYIGVALTGQYESQGSSAPVDYVGAFNYDIQEEALLSSLDLFPYAVHPQLFALIEDALLALNPGLDADTLGISAAWLEPAVLTEDGLRVYLRENRLSIENWPSYLELSYEQLNGLIFLDDAPAIIEMESPPITEPVDEAPVATEPLSPETPTQSPDLDPERPMLALTFDDGPSEITAQLLDLLARHQVPATFFMIGRQVAEYSGAVARMVEQGCEVASHTWNHPNLSRQTDAVIEEQLTRTAEAIELASGVYPNLLRPPYGEADAEVKAVAERMGIYLINWSIDTVDWKSRDAQAVYEHIMEKAKDGQIILCHDLYASTFEAMELAIPALLAEGYQFVTVSELLGIGGETRQPGVVYRHK